MSRRVSECFSDLLEWSRYLRCPIKFRYPLGGLINMTKKCHFVEFMAWHLDALLCLLWFGLAQKKGWQAAKLQMAKIVFTMPFDWSSNRSPCEGGRTTRKWWDREWGREEDYARTISLSLKQLILLFRWHLASTHTLTHTQIWFGQTLWTRSPRQLSYLVKVR